MEIATSRPGFPGSRTSTTCSVGSTRRETIATVTSTPRTWNPYTSAVTTAGYPWFCGLANADNSPELVATLRSAPNAVMDVDGHPWLYGSWPDARAMVIETAHARAVFFGSTCFAAKDAKAALDRAMRR